MPNKTAVIKKCKKSDIDPKKPKSEQVYCLYTKDGSRLLGRHKTKSDAEAQERAIQVSKHGVFFREALKLMGKP